MYRFPLVNAFCAAESAKNLTEPRIAVHSTRQSWPEIGSHTYLVDWSSWDLQSELLTPELGREGREGGREEGGREGGGCEGGREGGGESKNGDKCDHSITTFPGLPDPPPNSSFPTHVW